MHSLSECSDGSGDEIDGELLEGDYDLPAVTAVTPAPPLFGVNINEPLHPETVEVDVHVPVLGVALPEVPARASVILAALP